MGICSKRHFLLIVCVLQLIFTIERQVFDFLGYMWTPILLNFFNIILVIFGFFGGFQYRPKYIITYSVWNLLWLAWNSFLICFYLSVGLLDKDSSILNLGTGSVSWWEANGPGCKAVFSPDEIDPARQYRATSITDCLVQYEYVEICQASIQCLLACLGFISGVCLSRIFIDDDDRFDFLAGDGKSPRHLALQPMYVSYTSLTQQSTSKRSSLSRQHHPQQPHHKQTKLQQQNIFNDLSGVRRQNDAYSLNSLGSQTTLPSTFSSISRNYKKPVYITDSCETSYVLPRSKQKLVRTDQIRGSVAEIGTYNAISRSKSHERLSRRAKKPDSSSVRPKSLCGRSNFMES